MIELKSWYIETTNKKEIYLMGVVYGHPSIEDGTLMHTSMIESATHINNGLAVKTRNNTYSLKFEDVKIVIGEFVRADEFTAEKRLLAHYRNIITILYKELSKADVDNYSNLHAELFRDCYKEQLECCDTSIVRGMEIMLKSKLNDILCLIKNIKINDGEILLRLDVSEPFSFKCAIAKFNGKSTFIGEPCVHIGTIQDSVLIREPEKFDFRYFPIADKIDIYVWDNTIKKLVFHNVGCETIHIKHGSREIELLKNDVKELEYVE